jgi:methionyl-tRNA formyltransferase
VGVVIDYGFIINQDVIDYFPLGIINSHFSLLPEWRGADPITFAILSGQQQTGVSLMLIVAKMDEGPLLAQAPYDITESITTPELTNDLIEVSDQMLRQILPLYLDGKIQPADQASVTMAASPTPSYSRKLTKADGVIDWHKPAAQLEREVRAFIDWPKSRTRLGAHEVIISKAHVVPEVAADTKPGAVTSTAGKDGILVTTGDQTLCIDELKPIGKAAMSARAFLAGYHI